MQEIFEALSALNEETNETSMWQMYNALQEKLDALHFSKRIIVLQDYTHECFVLGVEEQVKNSIE